MVEQVHDFVFRGEVNERLDKFIVRCLPQFSRVRLQGLIHDGFVLVNDLPAKKPGQLVESGCRVRITIPPISPSSLRGESIPLEVVFENTDLLVINKPAGMVVHPAAGHTSGTLVHAVLGHDPEIQGIGGEERPGVVHRLDKDTSGLIVLAKNDPTHRWLQDQFRARSVQKKYLALVDGRPPTPKGRIEVPIGRDPIHRKKMALMPSGKGREAVSEYRTVETFRAHTLLEFHPITGRTHQVRLHCAFLNCPIVGDVLYGRRTPSVAINRHFLHAAELTLRLPGESKARQFTADLPGELQTILADLRNS
ncbi:MAG: RluA family pseudouridine synthase [Chloroflexi bacterium]|nr:RluA family pseudouridine synthase [Chloroflexota bacterium]